MELSGAETSLAWQLTTVPLISRGLPRWEPVAASSVENNDVIHPAGTRCKVIRSLLVIGIFTSLVLSGNASANLGPHGKWHEPRSSVAGSA